MAERGTVAIIGATSAIGRELAGVLAETGHALLLLARSSEDLADVAADLRVRHSARVQVATFDVTSSDAAIVCDALAGAEGLRGVVVTVGYLGDQETADRDPQEAAQITELNYSAPARVLDTAAAEMEKRRGGFIAAFSSVAGDRPRRRVYIYGTAKAALDAHLAALRHQLGPAGVRVLTLKLGPVDTRMPYGRRPQPMMIGPRHAALDIASALRDADGVVYVPRRWRWIMLGIKSIPGPLFRRLDL